MEIDFFSLGYFSTFHGISCIFLETSDNLIVARQVIPRVIYVGPLNVLRSEIGYGMEHFLKQANKMYDFLDAIFKDANIKKLKSQYLAIHKGRWG